MVSRFRHLKDCILNLDFSKGKVDKRLIKSGNPTQKEEGVYFVGGTDYYKGYFGDLASDNMSIVADVYLYESMFNNTGILTQGITGQGWKLDQKDTGEVRFTWLGEIDFVFNNYSFEANKRYHIVVTIETSGGNNTAKLYVNGELKDTYSAYGKAPLPTTHPLYINYSELSSDGINCEIYKVMFFKRALTSQEVSDLYNGSTFNYLKNLKHYWIFNNYNLTKDLVGNDNLTYSSGYSSASLGDFFGGKKAYETKSTAYITTNSSATYSDQTLSKEYTEFFWVKLDNFNSSSGIQRIIRSGGHQCGFSGTSFFAHSITKDENGTTYTDNNVVNTDVSSYMNEGEWTSIAVTRNLDTGKLKVYVNGDFVKEGTITNGVNGYYYLDSTQFNGSTQYIDGILASAMFFDKELTQNQIQDLMNLTKENKI